MGGGARAIVTHLGPTADGGGGAIVTHHGPMTGERTYDWRSGLKKEDKYTPGLMLHRTPDRALKNRTVRPKAGRMATLALWFILIMIGGRVTWNVESFIVKR